MMFYWHGIMIGEHSVSLPYSFNGANLNVLNGLVMTESRWDVLCFVLRFIFYPIIIQCAIICYKCVKIVTSM